MSYLAINIALIPPKTIIDDLIQLNSLCKGEKENFLLTHADRIPHMTVLMGWIEEKNIKKIVELLQQYKNTTQGGIISVSNNIKSSILPNGQSWQYLDIVSNPGLQSLYRYIIDTIKPLLSYEERKVGFFDNDTVNKLTMKWVYQHQDKQSDAVYHPHISIGIGELQETDYNETFMLDSISIYQLGNYCTCRNLLQSIPLSYHHVHY